MEFYAVSRCILSFYSPSEICMQCLTDLIVVLVAVESILRTRMRLYCIVIFGSLSSRNTQHPNFNRHVRYKMFEHHIARGYDLFQNGTYLYSQFERPYITNHLRCLVGFNEWRLEAAYCLEQF